MRTKHNLRKVSQGVLTALFGLFFTFGAGATLTTANAEETTSETSVVTNLYTPTATGENYTVGGYGKWLNETTVEDYADSPSGKVLHHTVDTNGITGGDFWPYLQVSIPYTGDTTDFAGYVVWLEYTAEMYTDSNFWGLFGLQINKTHFGGDKAITFIDENGKIDETKTGRNTYLHNNATAVTKWNEETQASTPGDLGGFDDTFGDDISDDLYEGYFDK